MPEECKAGHAYHLRSELLLKIGTDAVLAEAVLTRREADAVTTRLILEADLK